TLGDERLAGGEHAIEQLAEALALELGEHLHQRLADEPAPSGKLAERLVDELEDMRRAAHDGDARGRLFEQRHEAAALELERLDRRVALLRDAVELAVLRLHLIVRLGEAAASLVEVGA